MDWPAYSPDLNQIEHVLDTLGRRIAARLRHPENTQQLKQMLIEEWALLPQEMLQQLVLSSNTRIRADQLAKEATCQDMNLLMFVPLSHCKHSALERTVSSWNTEFLASPEALWTKRFFPTIYQRLKSTRGLLATDQVILNHGQVTWTTPEMAPPLLTTTPMEGRFSSLQIYRASLPYTAGLLWYWARTRDKASHDPIPIPLGYRDHEREEKFVFAE
ncbi:transposable element Tcb2 transposase [Trichonephila clavipes]|uniref:Transposable element Tcb2 transposase n=1 Tax=Trichonephila clavipes TaxID=2585209 RepID=A0A8X6SRF3_TRICX|nr:transposable element Tcb2 transposase [Trichonephila clavipes]